MTAMQRIAARIPVNDEDLVRHAIVHGLKDKIRRFVLMSRCTSIEEVMEAARLAEDTADDVPTTADRAMLRQLATQVSAIQEAVNKMANAPAARAPSSDNAVDAIGDSSASGNATSGPPSGRNPAATFRGRVRGGRARGWTPRHPWNGQFGGQPFWPAYGPTMAYAAFSNSDGDATRAGAPASASGGERDIDGTSCNAGCWTTTPMDADVGTDGTSQLYALYSARLCKCLRSVW